MSLHRTTIGGMELAEAAIEAATTIVADLDVDAAAWLDRQHRAALRLELEEDLNRQARGRGRELGDRRREQVTWLRRRSSTGPTGRRYEWLDTCAGSDHPTHARVTRVAMAYRHRP